MIIKKSARELKIMARVGRLVAETFEYIRPKIRPGIKTMEIDKLIDDFIRQRGAIPAFKGYRNYPAASCISINFEVVHGIPSERVIEEGQLVSIDIGIKNDGYFGDAAETIPVGRIDSDAEKLIKIAQMALFAGIEKARVGNRLYDISYAIQKTAENAGYSVVKEFVGHGIGQQMHEEPQVPNYGQPRTGPLLEEGMVLALEPMINIGGSEVEIADDNWGVLTKDRSLSAHFEHTVAITNNSAKILTIL